MHSAAKESRTNQRPSPPSPSKSTSKTSTPASTTLLQWFRFFTIPVSIRWRPQKLDGSNEWCRKELTSILSSSIILGSYHLSFLGIFVCFKLFSNALRSGSSDKSVILELPSTHWFSYIRARQRKSEFLRFYTPKIVRQRESKAWTKNFSVEPWVKRHPKWSQERHLTPGKL